MKRMYIGKWHSSGSGFICLLGGFIQVIVAFLKYWQRKQMVSTRRDVVLVMA